MHHLYFIYYLRIIQNNNKHNDFNTIFFVNYNELS
jgi:hypothetical protein